MDEVAAMGMSLPSVTDLTLRFSFDEGTSEEIPASLNCLGLFRSFPSLTGVHFPDDMNTKVEDIGVPALCSLSVPLETISTGIECMYSDSPVRSMVVAFGRTIKNLLLSGAPVEGDTLRLISSNCPCLKAVEFGLKNATYTDIVVFCTAAGRTLNRFVIDYHSGNIASDEDQFARKLSQLLPHVKHIDFMALENTTWYSLKYFLDLHPDAKYVRIGFCEFKDTEMGCKLTFFEQDCNTLMPYLSTFPKPIVKLAVVRCSNMSVENLGPFVDRRGGEVEDLKLDLTTTEVISDDAVVFMINGCTRLKSLLVTDWKTLSPEIVGQVESKNDLISFTLNGGPRSFSDQMLISLLRKFPKLSTLNVWGRFDLVTNISAIAAVDFCPFLQELDLHATAVTPEGIINVITRLADRPFRLISLSSEHCARVIKLLEGMGDTALKWKNKIKCPSITRYSFLNDGTE